MKTDDGKTRSQCLENDLTKGLGEAGKGKDAARRIHGCQSLALLMPHEGSIEAVTRAEPGQVTSRRAVTDKDKLGCSADRSWKNFEGLNEETNVLLPRDTADVEDDGLALQRR